jgi:hypothetical protein
MNFFHVGKTPTLKLRKYLHQKNSLSYRKKSLFIIFLFFINGKINIRQRVTINDGKENYEMTQREINLSKNNHVATAQAPKNLKGF